MAKHPLTLPSTSSENAFNQKDKAGYLYQATDISVIQEQIMLAYRKDFNIHQPLGDRTEIAGILGELINSVDEARPTLCVYNLGDWHWVVFAALKAGDTTTILYKDSRGSSNTKLKGLIEKHNPDVTFKIHPGYEQSAGVECGIFALKNMEIMAREISHNKEGFIKGFEDYPGFCSLETARYLRHGVFAEKYILGKYHEIETEATKASKLEKLREQHTPEAEAIGFKLKEVEFFKDFNIRALFPKESLVNPKNTIAIEIVVTPDINLDSISYAYSYIIRLSKDIITNTDEIVKNIRALFSEAEFVINIESGIIRISADTLTTIEKIPKRAITLYEIPGIEIGELLILLNIQSLDKTSQLLLQNQVQKILSISINHSLELNIPEQTVYESSQKNKESKQTILNIVDEYLFGSTSSFILPVNEVHAKEIYTSVDKLLEYQQNAFNQKKNEKYQYTAVDIKTIQDQIMLSYLNGFNIHKPLGDSIAINETLTKLINSIDENKPTLCVYNLGNRHWVVFAALKIGDKTTILYKDSKGAGNGKLEKIINNVITIKELDFIIHRGYEQPYGVECGIFALKNMEIMAKEISHNKEGFIKGFEGYQEFCSLINAKNLRKGEYAEKYVLGKYQEMEIEAIKASKLEKLREYHAIEAERVGAKIKEADFIKKSAINVSWTKASSSLTKNITIEIATLADTNPEDTNYRYVYRISLSKDFTAAEKEELAKIIGEIFPESKITTTTNLKDGIIRISADSVTSIDKLPKIPIEKPLIPSIKNGTLFNNLDIESQPFLQKEAEKIIINKTIDNLPLLSSRVTAKSTTKDLIKEYLGTGTLAMQDAPSEEVLTKVEVAFSQKIQEIGAQVKKIIQSTISSQEKIEQLKQIEKNEYESLIKTLAYKKTLEELKDLAAVFKDLGYLTKQIGDLSTESYKESILNPDLGDTGLDTHYKIKNIISEYLLETTPLKYYTDAAVLYQYVITIINEKINPERNNELYNEQLKEIYRELATIKKSIISISNTAASTTEVITEKAAAKLKAKENQYIKTEIEENKKILADLRDNTAEMIKIVDSYQAYSRLSKNRVEKQQYEDLYVNETRKLFQTIANDMQSFLAKLYRDSENELGEPPCSYTVIGLGSMALSQMTPYSDLEFAILTKDEKYKQSPDLKISQYFKNLTHLVHFKMINLGETIIPTSKYGLDLSHLVHRAVNFDLGGKTPLGRIDNDKPYDLIQTVEKMLRDLRNEDNKTSNRDKTLPYIIEKICYVHGDQKLVTNYQTKVTEFLHSKVDKNNPKSLLHYEVRAMKLLNEGVVELDYLKSGKCLAPIQGNIKTFQPSLANSDARLFDVKQEIYRLADRLIHDLGMCYGIEGESAWDTIDQLYNKGIINTKAAKNLQFAVTFATKLRLITYLHHKGQVEDMSLFVHTILGKEDLREQTVKIFHLSDEDLEIEGGLFKYFYTALPLHEKLKQFCSQSQTLSTEDKLRFFKGELFYSTNFANKGLIHYRLAQYNKSITNLEDALTHLQDYEDPKILEVKAVLGMIYHNFGKTDRAIEHFQDCVDIIDSHYKGIRHPSIAIYLSNIGESYRIKGEYDEALKYNNLSLEMKKHIYKKVLHPDIADSLNHLGNVYSDKGQFDEAIRYYNDSLILLKSLYKNKPHPDIAVYLNNLGNVYKAKGQYNEAIKYHSESLAMRKLIYKDEPHSYVADSLTHLGGVYRIKGQYDQAFRYCNDSYKMKKLIYKDNPHPDIAMSLNNLGTIYYSTGQFDEAIRYHTNSWEMRKFIYEEEPHSDIADSLDNLGLCYCAKGQFREALKYNFQSWEMRKLMHKGGVHPAVAVSLDNLGGTYNSLGEYGQAIEWYNQSYEIRKRVYNEEPHPEIAGSLHNLRSTYAEMGQYDEAIEYSTNCWKMRKLIYNNEPHPDIAQSLNSIGARNFDKGNYFNAIKFYKECFEMRKLIYKDKAHPETAFSLNNIGNAYIKQGQYNKGMKYHTKSLVMRKLIYMEESHPDIAQSLNCIGNIYSEKGDHDKAIEYFVKGLKMYRSFFNNEPHPDIATCLNNLGIYYDDKKQYDKAIECYTESLEMREIIYKGKPHPEIADSLNNLGTVYVEFEEDKAIEYYNKGLIMRKLIHNNEPHPDIADSLNNIGNAYRYKDQYNQAILFHNKSLNIQKLIFKEKLHSCIADSLNYLGIAYLGKGQYDKALYYFINSVKVYYLSFHNTKEISPKIIDSLKHLAFVYIISEKKDLSKACVKHISCCKKFMQNNSADELPSTKNNKIKKTQEKITNYSEKVFINFDKSAFIGDIDYITIKIDLSGNDVIEEIAS